MDSKDIESEKHNKSDIKDKFFYDTTEIVCGYIIISKSIYSNTYTKDFDSIKENYRIT